MKFCVYPFQVVTSCGENVFGAHKFQMSRFNPSFHPPHMLYVVLTTRQSISLSHSVTLTEDP